MRFRGSCMAMAIGLLAPADVAAEVPDVVASVKPIHSLVAGVMAGVAEPTLLVRGAASPHTYALRPSDATALEDADVVFWIGEPFETFLAKPLQALSDESRIVELAESEALALLPPREGGLWEPHLDGHGDGVDGHMWLDPRNARIMTARIASVLAERDPEHAEIYRTNADALQARLDVLDAALAARLTPVKNVPFIVFHDAYQYLEKRYGLAGVGSITVSPEQPPGARRIQEVQEKIASRGARCVFSEPNFEPALVDMVTAGTPARSGVLDPEGASLAEGAELYFELLRGIGHSLRSCLAAGS